MKRKKWVNKVIALLLAAIMIVPSSLGTVAYAQEPEVSSEQLMQVKKSKKKKRHKRHKTHKTQNQKKLKKRILMK